MADGELGLRSATELVGLLAAREVSAVELLDVYLERIERLNPPVNAVVTIDEERARAAAVAADEARARGDEVGALGGLPVSIKDCIETAGLRTTAGAVELSAYVPEEDADAVALLRGAGANIFAKTNLPAWASDSQTYNEVFGTTNNPWDLGRTPGGSSGGGAAAVATGLTPLELGSDLGGSIRIPAHFCGVYGLKATHGIISTHGHIPPPPGMSAEIEVLVVGPLARSADDLDLALDALAAPDRHRAKAWRLELPPPRQTSLRDYRIAVVLDDPICRTTTASADLLAAAVDALTAAGAQVRVAKGQPTLARGLDIAERLIQGSFSIASPPDAFEAMVAEAASLAPDDVSPHARWVRNTTQRARDLQVVIGERLELKADWQHFFEDADVLLTPAMPWPAFEHDQNPDADARFVHVDDEDRPYSEQFAWLQAVGVAHLPAVVAPIGLTPQGLPVGIQIVADLYDDRTAIDVARRMADVVGGFVAPPGA